MIDVRELKIISIYRIAKLHIRVGFVIRQQSPSYFRPAVSIRIERLKRQDGSALYRGIYGAKKIKNKKMLFDILEKRIMRWKT